MSNERKGLLGRDVGDPSAPPSSSHLHVELGAVGPVALTPAPAPAAAALQQFGASADFQVRSIMLDVEVKFQLIGAATSYGSSGGSQATESDLLAAALGGSLTRKLRLQISPNDVVVNLVPIILARVGDISPYKFVKGGSGWG